MTRRRFTLRISHLLMWSSPLLLLVLVFTLNSRPLHATTTSLVPTTIAPTIARARRATTTTKTPSRTDPTTPTPTNTGHLPVSTRTRPSLPVTSNYPTTTTTPSVVATTSVPHVPSSFATAPNAGSNVNSEDRAGSLTLNSPEVLFPLRGPGKWLLAADHPITSELICGTRSLAVGAIVHLSTPNNCQLAITIATGAPTSWNLRAHS